MVQGCEQEHVRACRQAERIVDEAGMFVTVQRAIVLPGGWAHRRRTYLPDHPGVPLHPGFCSAARACQADGAVAAADRQAARR